MVFRFIVGNEDAARNFGFVYPARGYSVFVLEDQHYDCALSLLSDESYEVKNPVDVEAYYKIGSKNRVNVNAFIFKKMLLPAGFFMIAFISLVWWMRT